MSFQKLILPDSNFWINAFSGKSHYLKDVKRAATVGYSVIITTHIFNEVDRKIPNGKEKLMQYCIELNKKCPEIKILKDQKEIIKLAEEMESRFTGCHYPDNRILATAMYTTAILVTSDRNLLKAADFEGVQSCTPGNFLRYAGC